VLDTIKTLKDPAAAEAVAAWLAGGDRGKAADALKAMGTGAEGPVLKYLTDSDENVRAEACRILQVVGTTASIPALEDLIRKANGQGGAAAAARDAIENMQSLPAEKRRPPESDFIARVLYDLKSPLLQRRRDALGRLINAPPTGDRRAEVAKAVEPVIRDVDVGARIDAARTLGIWGGKANTRAVVEALRDPVPSVRSAALDACVAIKDPAAAEAVAALLPSDRGRAIEALKRMGRSAERAAIKYLGHNDVFVRAEVCKLLREIGTQRCVPALMDLFQRTNGNGLDGSAAKETLQALGFPVQNGP
jgi:HEAT repeat protein